MNESGHQPNDWHMDTEHHDATPADALHTMLTFTVKYRDLFKAFLNERLATSGSNLVLDDEDITEALENIDDILHIAMSRRNTHVRTVKISPEMLRTVLEQADNISSIDTSGINVIEEDPDRNTGQYL